MTIDPIRLLGRTNINVTRNGSDNLRAIVQAGFEGIRVPVTIADAGPPSMTYDLRPYLLEAQALGLKVLLVLDRDAFYWPDWSVSTAQYVRHWLDVYAGLYAGLQIGNEPDHQSPSSWDLPGSEFSALMRAVRAEAGPDAYLIAGGLASGDPSYLDGVDLSSVNAYAVHPYAKDAPNPNDLEDWPDVDALYHAYELQSPLPVITSEWGFPGDASLKNRQAEEVEDMVRWAGEHGTPFYYFNWRDSSESFGLLDSNGNPKPSLPAVWRAINDLPPLELVPPSTPPAREISEDLPVPPPLVNPWQFFSPQQIALAADCTEAAVMEHWPRVVAQLELVGINRRNVQLAAIGTIAIETGGPDRSRRFTPVEEAYWITDPAARQRELARYWPYFGRGLVQLTWLKNYQLYSDRLDALWQAGGVIDLVADPSQALEPDVAAAVFALYFAHTRALPTATYPEGYSLVQAADAQDWEWVRKLVQGGTAGLDRLKAIAAQLGGGTAPAAQAPVVFDRAYPTIAQNDDWSCWPTSARWLLAALGADADGDGLPPTEAYVEAQAIRDGIVSQAQGLLVATAGPAAAWLNSQWLDAMGLKATPVAGISWDQVVAAAQEGGLLLGGTAWNHWTAVRAVTPAGELALANPDTNWKGVGEVLDRAEWDRWGRWNAILVPITEQEDPTVIAQLQAQVAQLTAERDEYHQQRDVMMTHLAEAVDVEGDKIAAALTKQREYREAAIGPRPAVTP